jgi:hypothetical protein
MATQIIVNLSDSLDERIKSGVETVTFYHPLTGEKLEIELGEANRKHFSNHVDKLQKYIDAAEVVVEEVPAAKPKAVKNNDTAKIREWARANGFEIGDRGRIKAEIMTAYTAAHEVIVTNAENQVQEPSETVAEAEATPELAETENSAQDSDEMVSEADVLDMLAEMDKAGVQITEENLKAALDESNASE